MDENDIKQKIEQVLIKSKDPGIYINILKDFFTNGIEKSSPCLNSLSILPKLKDKDLQNNIRININNINYFIKNNIKSTDGYKVLSCIYGAFLGDALGAFCEFHKFSKDNYKMIFKNYPVFGGVKGQVTDDSEMAMSLAYAIMDTPQKENLDENYIYFYYGAWGASGPLDIGKTTKNALQLYNFLPFYPNYNNFQKIKNEIFTLNSKSLSNGFLMRKSTFIAWLYFRFYNDITKAFYPIDQNEDLIKLYEKIKLFSQIDNQCTHPNLHTSVVSAFYCIMALGAIKGLRANNIIDKLDYLCKDQYFKKKEEEKNVTQFISYYIGLFKSNTFNYYNCFIDPNSHDCINKNIGWYGHAFKLTLYYLIYLEQIDEKNRFRTIMNEICNLGGDTDTNACILGGVIGPLIGLSNFGDDFNKIIEVIPPSRAEYSISLMYLYVRYLKKSNRDNELIKNERIFLYTILSLLYDTDMDIDY